MLNYPRGEEWSWASPSVVSLLCNETHSRGQCCSIIPHILVNHLNNVLWSIKSRLAKAWGHILHYLWIMLAWDSIHHYPLRSNYYWNNTIRKLNTTKSKGSWAVYIFRGQLAILLSSLRNKKSLAQLVFHLFFQQVRNPANHSSYLISEKEA